MKAENQHLDTLQDIKQMMNRSSRFISLSGLSGVGAGICALVGAYVTNNLFQEQHRLIQPAGEGLVVVNMSLVNALLRTGLLTFLAALLVAFVFTYVRSVRTSTPIWGATARRLLWNTLVPLAAGGIFVYHMVLQQEISLIAPSCLLFYGLALLNGSKYTLSEIRWLAYSELVLGLTSLWWPGYGLLFWTIGFGALHIVYGAIMWWKYERNNKPAR